MLQLVVCQFLRIPHAIVVWRWMNWISPRRPSLRARPGLRCGDPQGFVTTRRLSVSAHSSCHSCCAGRTGFHPAAFGSFSTRSKMQRSKTMGELNAEVMCEVHNLRRNVLGEPSRMRLGKSSDGFLPGLRCSGPRRLANSMPKSCAKFTISVRMCWGIDKNADGVNLPTDVLAVRRELPQDF